MKKLSFVLLIFISFCLCACSSYKNKSGVICVNSSFIDVSIYDYSLDKCENAFDNIENIFKQIAKLCDYKTSYEGLNNVYTINSSEKEVVVDEFLYNLLKEAVDYQTITEGLYNPFMGNIYAAYDELLAMNIGNITLDKIPNDNFLKTELNNSKNTKIIFSEQERSVRKIGDGKIDLRDIANSYALKLSKAYLNNQGIYNYFLNVDLNNVSLGNKHNSSYYSVGVRDIDSLVLKIKNKDICSSSILENNFDLYGKRYHKFISTVSGKPENMYDICVVIDNDPVRASIFSRIFITLETEKFTKFYLKYNFDILIFKDKEIVYQTKKENIYG